MVTADASGNYAFTGLSNGAYTVTPSKTGMTYTPASQPATVNNANVTALNFSTVTYSISGTISGAGGNAATVNLTGTSTATVTADASGNYTFTGLLNGPYTVTPSKTGFAFTPANQNVTVSSANLTAVNFSTVTYTISGTISGAGGNGATVNLTGAATATTTADASGNYTFSGLLNGAYTVTPSQTGFTFTPASQAATVSNANVTALNFSTVTYTISGTISGPGGSGATVNLTGAATATVTADASGNYTFTGLNNGAYTVTPSKTGMTYTPASQPATVSNANVTALNFSTVTYTISGTISGTGGNAATVKLTGAATATRHRRRFRQLHLQRPGERRLHGHAQQRRVHLHSAEPGRDRQLRERHRRGLRLRGADHVLYLRHHQRQRRQRGHGNAQRDRERDHHGRRFRQFHLQQSEQRVVYRHAEQDRLHLHPGK